MARPKLVRNSSLRSDCSGPVQRSTICIQMTSELDSQSGRAMLELRKSLLRGEFHPGERLSELPLVARLGVSRTPIRLALERLAHEGLLEASRSGGFIVREFTVDAVWDAIEVRGVLEGTAARLAAERLEKD